VRATPDCPTTGLVVGQSDFARLGRLTTLLLLRVVLDGLRIGPLRLVRVHGRGVACSSNHREPLRENPLPIERHSPAAGASMSMNLGNEYFSFGDHAKAIEYRAQNLAIAKEVGDRAG
jgi:hypothetical protein